jgi:hypothetical protein
MGCFSLSTLVAGRISALRKTRSGGGNRGRPRTVARRFPCEAITLKRAHTRGKSSEHDPACPFYRECASVV